MLLAPMYASIHPLFQYLRVLFQIQESYAIKTVLKYELLQSKGSSAAT